MYAVVTRGRCPGQPVDAHARDEFFAKLRQAPGFVSLSVIELEDGINVSVLLWESRAHAEDFRAERAAFEHVLDERAPLQSREAGEVFQHVTPTS
jgi:hypothetical protein